VSQWCISQNYLFFFLAKRERYCLNMTIIFGTWSVLRFFKSDVSETAGLRHQQGRKFLTQTCFTELFSKLPCNLVMAVSETSDLNNLTTMDNIQKYVSCLWQHTIVKPFIFSYVTTCFSGQLSKVIGYSLGMVGFRFQVGTGIFLFTFRLALRSTHRRVHWISEAIFPG
jgi:hypothetical protein